MLNDPGKVGPAKLIGDREQVVVRRGEMQINYAAPAQEDCTEGEILHAGTKLGVE